MYEKCIKSASKTHQNCIICPSLCHWIFDFFDIHVFFRYFNYMSFNILTLKCDKEFGWQKKTWILRTYWYLLWIWPSKVKYLQVTTLVSILHTFSTVESKLYRDARHWGGYHYTSLALLSGILNYVLDFFLGSVRLSTRNISCILQRVFEISSVRKYHFGNWLSFCAIKSKIF